MDKLLKEAQEHGKIQESLTFFGNAITSLSGYFEEFKSFIDIYIKNHFNFEAKELFPIIVKNGTPKEKNLIQEFLKEHQAILIICNKFNILVEKYGLQPRGTQYKEIQGIQKKIIESMLVHTQKEDDKLFPILKRYENNLI